jgi:hypothetical protein
MTTTVFFHYPRDRGSSGTSPLMAAALEKSPLFIATSASRMSLV